MIKQGTLRSDIVAIVKEQGMATCAEIVRELEVKRGKSYDASDINTYIYWMLKEEILKVVEGVRGPKGGRTFTIGKTSQTKRLVLKLKFNATSNN